MKCSKCGAYNDYNEENDVLFCNVCGAKLEEKDNSNVETNTNNNNNTNNNTVSADAAIAVGDNSQKSQGGKTLESIGVLITGGLSIISIIMCIGSFLGFFDKNPIPFIIFAGVVILFGWVEDKFPSMPTIAVAVLEIIALIICFNIANNVGAVNSVKGGHPEGYPSISYEKAFDYYFADPVWKKVADDEDGNKVVKFTGNCSYLDASAVAEIKFTLYEEQNSFVVSSVKINGTDMGLLEGVFLMEIFEEYDQNH